MGRARGRAREDRRVYTQGWKFAAALSRPRFESRRATPNDVVGFLRRRETVRRVAFVGVKALRRFRTLNPSVRVRGGTPGTLDLGGGRTVEFRVVPSARGGGEEELRAKAEAWAEALLGEDGERTNARRPDETDAEPEPSDAAGRGS